MLCPHDRRSSSFFLADGYVSSPFPQRIDGQTRGGSAVMRWLRRRHLSEVLQPLLQGKGM